jgi:hypothetical protein
MTRFKKAQLIYSVEIHQGIAIKVHPQEVISCGKKVLKLKGEWRNTEVRLNNGFCKIGTIGNFIEQFYETKESAEKAKQTYNS